MGRHTARLFECQKCGKSNYFLISTAQKDGSFYYMTQCPKCKSFDECRNITENEFQIHNRNVNPTGEYL